MKSPFTGKEMPVRKEWRSVTFRKEVFQVLFHNYHCEDTGEHFEDEAFAQLNFNQAVNQYREKYCIPFPDQIIANREKYEISAAAMAEILGFGINTYRQYEAGEVPSQSNSRLIQLAEDPYEFRKLLDLCTSLEPGKKEKIRRRIEALIQQQKNKKSKLSLENYFMGPSQPSSFTGFREPSLQKLTEMVVFFTEKLQPFKTKLNKLLFYADFSMFAKTGFSISGIRYSAIPLGPVPDNFNGIYEYLEKNNEVDILYTSFPDGGTGEQFMPKANRPLKKDLFTEAEWTLLADIVQRFKNTTTSEIIHLSHQEKAWKENQQEKAFIDYRLGFELLHNSDN